MSWAYGRDAIIHVGDGDIVSTLGDVQYINIDYRFSSVSSHMNLDLDVLNTPSVLMNPPRES